MVGSSASDAAEDSDVACSPLCGELEDGATVAAQAPTESGVGKSEPIARAGNQFDSKLVAGGPDELGEGPKNRFAMVGFVGADDRLRDASGRARSVCDRRARRLSFAQHWDGGRACGRLLVWPGLRLGLGLGLEPVGARFVCVWCQDLGRPPAAGPAAGCGGTSRSRIVLDQEHRDAPRPCLLLETDSIPMERTWSEGP